MMNPYDDGGRGIGVFVSERGGFYFSEQEEKGLARVF